MILSCPIMPFHRISLISALKTAPVGGVANIVYTQQDAINAHCREQQKLTPHLSVEAAKCDRRDRSAEIGHQKFRRRAGAGRCRSRRSSPARPSALVGHNGAGKSTLMNVLSGTMAAEQRPYRRPGCCARAITASASRKRLGFAAFFRSFRSVRTSPWRRTRASRIRNSAEPVGEGARLSLIQAKLDEIFPGMAYRRISRSSSFPSVAGRWWKLRVPSPSPTRRCAS